MQSGHENMNPCQIQTPLRVSYFPEFDTLERNIKKEIAISRCPQAGVYQSRLESLATFADPEKMIEREGYYLSHTSEDNLGRAVDNEKVANELIKEYFFRQDVPVDIAIILHGGLCAVHLLHDAVNIHNFLFYRPENSPNSPADISSYLVGCPNPERNLLLIENDMLSGSTLRRTADFFQGRGYARENMYAFLYYGAYRKFNINLRKIYVPELGRLNKVLDRTNDNPKPSRWSLAAFKQIFKKEPVF